MSLVFRIGSPPSAILIICLIGSISIIVITPNVVSSERKSNSKFWPYSSSHWAQHYHPLLYSPSSSLSTSPSASSSESRYKNGLSGGPRRHHQSGYYYPESSSYSSSSGRLSSGDEINHNQFGSDDPEQIYSLSERYDYEDDDHKKHTKVEHHEHEIKEMSFVYPVLLALLILGALFIPFISLFFFLAVSAFNCNGGLGSNGFGQVTPFLGRRRRRRRSISLPASSSSSSSTVNNNTVSNEIGSSNEAKRRETRDDDKSIEGAHLPRLVLFDAAAAADQQASDAAGRQLPISDYEFWRKQLARNTVRLRDALVEFGGAWLDQQDLEEESIN